MTEPDSCGECEIIAEKYQKYLEGEKKNLISFRGHGFFAKKSLQKIEPFSPSEIKTMLKLILLGCKKLHFVQNEEPIDVFFNKVRMVSALQNAEKRFAIFVSILKLIF